MEHTQLICTTEHDDGGATCMFCAGGLFACTVCGAFEGATPDHCPGERMTEEQSDAVYAGTLNFRDGQWRKECCAIMRHVHDRAAWLAEQGYAALAASSTREERAQHRAEIVSRRERRRGGGPSKP